MKKVFTIKTKNNTLLGHLNYNVFANDIKEAVSKVQKVIEDNWFIDMAEYLCDIDEDSDLEEYLKEKQEEKLLTQKSEKENQDE